MIERIIRALRGGSWSSYPYNLRAPPRSWHEPDYRIRIAGFRLVVRIEGDE